MEKYQKINKIMEKISKYPMTYLTQKSPVEYEISFTGPLMESFERLGEIQEEIKREIGNEFSLKTVYGDGQDALLIFKEI